MSMMTFVYVIGLIKNDYSVIDIFWPLGFLLLVLFLDIKAGCTNQQLVKFFVTFWALRLSPYLLYRIIKKGPDLRYKELQLAWGKSHRVHAFFKVFMLQGFLMFLIAMPIITGQYCIDNNTFLKILGIVLCIIGICLESAADLSLYLFKQKKENAGKYLMTGLYKYSRHPNYLGELLFWYGIACLTVQNPYFYLTILGPLVLTYALYKFSGVPYAERNHHKSAIFREYAKKTGAIFPKFWQ